MGINRSDRLASPPLDIQSDGSVPRASLPGVSHDSMAVDGVDAERLGDVAEGADQRRNAADRPVSRVARGHDG